MFGVETVFSPYHSEQGRPARKPTPGAPWFCFGSLPWLLFGDMSAKLWSRPATPCTTSASSDGTDTADSGARSVSPCTAYSPSLVAKADSAWATVPSAATKWLLLGVFDDRKAGRPQELLHSGHVGLGRCELGAELCGRQELVVAAAARGRDREGGLLGSGLVAPLEVDPDVHVVARGSGRPQGLGVRPGGLAAREVRAGGGCRRGGDRASGRQEGRSGESTRCAEGAC